MIGYFGIGFVLAVIAVGVLLAFLDKLETGRHIDVGGTCGALIMLFLLVMCLWGVVLPIALVAGPIVLVRYLNWRKKNAGEAR